MSEDGKNDWAEASIVKDLNYLRTGVKEYDGKKVYYSTGSIKDDSINSEGSYTYSDRPSRANRVGQIGDIFQARMKDTDKAVLINDSLKEQLFSTGFFQIRTDPKTLLPKYLFHYFKSFVFLNQKDSNCSGSTQSALNDKSAQKLSVPIAPIPIQRAIVSKIEELFSDLDEGIADLKKAKDQLKVYRQAVLKKAFEGEFTREWRENHPTKTSPIDLLFEIKEEREKLYQQRLEEWKMAVFHWENEGSIGKKPSKPKSSKTSPPIQPVDLKDRQVLPSGWQWSKLDHCSSVIVDCPHSTPKWSDTGFICLRTTNFFRDQLDLNEVRYVSKETYIQRTERLKPKRNDILYSREGGILGISCILDTDEAVCLGQRMMLIRIGQNCSPKYFSYYLNSPNILSLVNSLITGCAAPHINVGDVKNYIIPLSSTEEQHKIVREIESRLSVCDKVEESIKESLEKAGALRQSILKKAFEGKLLSAEEVAKCKQHKDYEPASVLLERIKKEKKKR
tara:strand:- start:13183 stop:14700 length:1518 start_codon:yes stop_codon:yes gene_type:complete